MRRRTGVPGAVAATAVALVWGTAGGALAQVGDVSGAQDPPLLPRPPGYYIARYATKTSGEHVFCSGARSPFKVKGSVARFTYRPLPETTPLTGAEIRRHYRGSLTASRVRMTCDLSPRLDAMILSEGREIWVDVDASKGDAYEVVIVEREAPQRPPFP